MESFLISLFLTEENKGSILREDFFGNDRYTLYTQRCLERRKNSGQPVIPQLTPDILIQTADFALILDATDTDNLSEAYDDKCNKYKHLGSVIVVACNKKGILSHRAQGIPDNIRYYYGYLSHSKDNSWIKSFKLH